MVIYGNELHLLFGMNMFEGFIMFSHYVVIVSTA